MSWLSRSRPQRGWLGALALLLVLSAVAPLLTATPAGLAKRDQSRHAQRATASGKLTDAVAAALRDAGHALPGGVNVVPAEQRGDWSFGTAALLGTDVDGAPPVVVFYIAQQKRKQWRAEVEPTSAYRQLLRGAPAGLVPAVFQESTRLSAQATPKPPKLAMPMMWPTNLRLRLAPYVNPQDSNGIPSMIDLEFEVPAEDIPCEPGVCTTFPWMAAAAAGYAAMPCATDTGPGSVVVIQHPDGYRTIYTHLDLAAPQFEPGQVQRQDPLGYPGRDGSTDCSGQGEVYPSRVGFSLRRVTSAGDLGVDIRTVPIGGWTATYLPNLEQTCFQKTVQVDAYTREDQTACQGDVFPNDGSRGDGVRFDQSPRNPKRGDKVRLTIANLPRINNHPTEVAYVWYDSSTGQLRDRTVKSLPYAQTDKNLSITFKQPGGVPRQAVLCIKYAETAIGYFWCQ